MIPPAHHAPSAPACPHVRRPVVSAETVLQVLDVDRLKLDAWLLEGRLGFVFDIAKEFPHAEGRSELRFLTADLALVQAGQRVPERTPEAVALTVWGEYPQVRTRRMLRGLSCSKQHLYDLANRRILPMAPGACRRRGCGGSGTWRLADVVHFPATRRV